MFLRKLSNKFYLFSQKRRFNRNYIDVNAKIAANVRLMSTEIHGNVALSEGVVIHKSIISGRVSIGRNTTLWGPNIEVLSNIYPITIGNFCSIARDVTIHEYLHDYSRMTTYMIHRNLLNGNTLDDVISKGAITIGHDVWIGTGVQIMSGVTIGNGAVIGANSVVTKNVEPYTIVGGNPAKLIRSRFTQERIEELEKLEWWNWTIEQLQANSHLFAN